MLAASTTSESGPSPARSVAAVTKRRAWSTQDVENDEKYAYSVNVSSGSISGGSWTSRHDAQTRGCSGNVCSGASSASAVRKSSHGGVAPRSTKLVRSGEPQSRQMILLSTRSTQ